MQDFINLFIHRARSCPVACFIKVIFLLLFVLAVTIACFFQLAMSKHEYAGFVIAIGYVAVLALVTHRNCRLKRGR